VATDVHIRTHAVALDQPENAPPDFKKLFSRCEYRMVMCEG
jgi:hypothetical protein